MRKYIDKSVPIKKVIKCMYDVMCVKYTEYELKNLTISFLIKDLDFNNPNKPKEDSEYRCIYLFRLC